jgi:phosphocarrier protein HPr
VGGIPAPKTFVHRVMPPTPQSRVRGHVGLDQRFLEVLHQDALIINKLGLHARASAKLTQLASSFKCDVMMSRNNRRVNAKSIMGVMMLAAAKGMTVSIETNGVDEAQAMEALVKLIGDYFGEGE